MPDQPRGIPGIPSQPRRDLGEGPATAPVQWPEQGPEQGPAAQPSATILPQRPTGRRAARERLREPEPELPEYAVVPLAERPGLRERLGGLTGADALIAAGILVLILQRWLHPDVGGTRTALWLAAALSVSFAALPFLVLVVLARTLPGLLPGEPARRLPPGLRRWGGAVLYAVHPVAILAAWTALGHRPTLFWAWLGSSVLTAGAWLAWRELRARRRAGGAPPAPRPARGRRRRANRWSSSAERFREHTTSAVMDGLGRVAVAAAVTTAAASFLPAAIIENPWIATPLAILLALIAPTGRAVAPVLGAALTGFGGVAVLGYLLVCGLPARWWQPLRRPVVPE